MHLIWFHRVLIAAAIIFFIGFGIWELSGFRATGELMALVLAVGSFAAAAALGLYLHRLRRILGMPER